jgi:hypothetical protein
MRRAQTLAPLLHKEAERGDNHDATGASSFNLFFFERTAGERARKVATIVVRVIDPHPQSATSFGL